MRDYDRPLSCGVRYVETESSGEKISEKGLKRFLESFMMYFFFLFSHTIQT